MVDYRRSRIAGNADPGTGNARQKDPDVVRVFGETAKAVLSL
jgi:hypothetical protein